MEYVDIRVALKHATYDNNDPNLVCGNKDYMIRFDFDEEWEGRENKTARFVTDSGYMEVLFTGNECLMPMFANVRWVEIGVFAGDLQTTTPAYIPMDRSILCGDNTVHPDPPEDVYNQIVERLNEIDAGGGGGTADIDPSQVITVVDELPSPDGDEQVVYLTDDPTDGDQGAPELLVTILRNASYVNDQTANIETLARILGVESSVVGQVIQIANRLIITGDIAVVRDGATLRLT